MKILHLNASDMGGGAARAAYRLHKALKSEGIDSSMLVQKKIGDDYDVFGPDTKISKGIALLRPSIDSLPLRFYKKRRKTLFSPSWLGFNGIVNKIEAIDPDIVHLHWICGGMIRIEDLSKIDKPIVWSLHDNWAFTGGCHIKWDCEKHKTMCGSCPVLGSDKELDLSRWIWKRKEQSYKRIKNMTVIGLSRWVRDSSKESSLMNTFRHIYIPNPINTKIFKPFSQGEARNMWNIPKNKKLILFGAMGATTDINKGFEKLVEALNYIDAKDVEFIVFGSSEPKNQPNFNFPAHYVGRLYDDVSLVSLYNAVDVMVVPSLQENLSNAIMESLSCGTPVAAFDVGGNGDLIDHKKNGYLAQPFDSQDLATGIEWILDNPDYESLKKKAREKVLREFDSHVVAEKYIRLYREILHGK